MRRSTSHACGALGVGPLAWRFHRRHLVLSSWLCEQDTWPILDAGTGCNSPAERLGHCPPPCCVKKFPVTENEGRDGVVGTWCRQGVRCLLKGVGGGKDSPSPWACVLFWSSNALLWNDDNTKGVVGVEFRVLVLMASCCKNSHFAILEKSPKFVGLDVNPQMQKSQSH